VPLFAISNPLHPLITVFESILRFFHDTAGLGWGTSIVALTLIVRMCLLPLTLKQFKSMQSMARLQPEIKKLQERYKGDKERLNQEMMRFYRENKVNPFASCLPMVAQLPVFLSLYYMLRADLRRDICPDVNTAHVATTVPCGNGGEAQFLFIPDLTNRAFGVVLIVLIVLYVGSQLASTLLMSTTTDRTQRMLFLAMPFFFVLFVWQFPAGLLVYWITTNVWTIAQQAIVRRRLGPIRPAGAQDESLSDMFGRITGRSETPAGAGGGSSGPGGSSGGAATDGESTPRPSARREKVGVGGREPKGRPSGPPPSPPRKKKKRSGRRR
jgi:YidC/Oxa1 family membrane protein insertase